MDASPADKVERHSIDGLLSYARNARTHSDEEIAQIAASIKEWGWNLKSETGHRHAKAGGSGTTIIAAEMMRRACHAIEINPAYVDVAVKRW